jgi:hypothetical protein
MATTSNTYTGNGSNKLFSITFPYLDESDIDVYLNGTLQTITTHYFFANATTIEFVTAPSNGAVVLLDRTTDDSALQATFFNGSTIRSSDLNDNFDQVLFIAQETTNDAAGAIASANTAITTANNAVTTANNAVTTANAASASASAAVSTANTANTNVASAISTANTASSNASAAVSTANGAVSTANSAAVDAATAISTANGAVSTANGAVSTANAATATATTAATNASNAVTTANTASTTAGNAVTTANNAVSTANSAVTTAGSAVTTANNAVTTANSAVYTANAASSTANAAAAAVANALLFTTVANVAAIPASPANNAAVEVIDSTGIQSFTPLAGIPAGFIGDSGLSVRIVYTTASNTWSWIQYFPNDPEDRYANVADGATGAGLDKIFFQNDQTVTTSYTIPSGKNALSTGPIGISVGINAIVSANSTWVIL